MKKRVGLVILVTLILAISLGVAEIINRAYFSGYEKKLAPNTAFSASDSIGFYGSFLSFAGTIALGALAIYQTIEANSLSKRLMSIEEARYKLEVRPFFVLSGWRVDRKHIMDIIHETDLLSVDIGSNDSEQQLCLTLSLTNTTSSYISIKYDRTMYVDERVKCDWTHGYLNTFDNKLRISAGETKELRFYGIEDIFKDTLNKDAMSFAFTLENRFGERYTEIFDAGIGMLPPATKGGLPYIFIDGFNYRIGKNTFKDGKLDIEWEKVLPETLSIQ